MNDSGVGGHICDCSLSKQRYRSIFFVSLNSARALFMEDWTSETREIPWSGRFSVGQRFFCQGTSKGGMATCLRVVREERKWPAWTGQRPVDDKRGRPQHGANAILFGQDHSGLVILSLQGQLLDHDLLTVLQLLSKRALFNMFGVWYWMA